MSKNRYFGKQSKVGAAQQEKNLWKRRANVAENYLRRIRKLVDDDTEDQPLIDGVCDVLDEWDGLADIHDRREKKCGRCRGTGLVDADRIPAATGTDQEAT